MDPAASATIPTENHNPRLKPNKTPATIRPSAMKKPTVNADLKNEKSIPVVKTMADRPVNNANVTIAA